MNMPGGLICAQSGTLKTGWRKADISGADELSLWEFCAGSNSRADIIDKLIDTHCIFEAQEQSAQNLCLADRNSILAVLACEIGAHFYWQVVTCPKCQKPSDIAIDLSALPVKSAADTFPYAEVTHEGEVIKLRVPSGVEQREALTASKDVETAIAALAGLCCESAPKAKLNKEVVSKINNAVQEVSPELPHEVLGQCAECQEEIKAPIKILPQLMKSLDNPLDDVHEIAASYHWSEKDILSMPVKRRQHYLLRIAADFGG